jgi:hypothetical protein
MGLTRANFSIASLSIGGLGAGMFCMEGTGAIHMSTGISDIFNEPGLFAAIAIKGLKNGAKVLEGPVPNWKNLDNAMLETVWVALQPDSSFSQRGFSALSVCTTGTYRQRRSAQNKLRMEPFIPGEEIIPHSP